MMSIEQPNSGRSLRLAPVNQTGLRDVISTLLEHTNFTLRNLPHAALVTWVVCLGGWLFVAQMPDTYTASARIFVGGDLLSALLQDIGVDSRTSVNEAELFQRTLTSRPNLARAVELTGFQNDSSELGFQAILQGVAARTSVTLQGRNLFTITYVDQDAQRARDLLDTLLSTFVEQRLGQSREEIESALRFIDEQLVAYNREADVAEEAIAVFRQNNVRALSRQATLEASARDARAELSRVKDGIAGAEARVEVLSAELSETPQSIALQTDQIGGPPSDATLELLELDARLSELLVRYTERHPDVIAVRRRLEELNKPNAFSNASSESTLIPNDAYSQLVVELRKAEAELASLTSLEARTQGTLTEFEGAITEVSQIQGRLAELSRDRDVLRDRQEELVQRREEVRLSRERELAGRSSVYRVIEAPRIPLAPDGPNRLLFLAVVLAAGLLSGAAFSWILGFASDTFTSPERLQEVFNRPVIRISLVRSKVIDFRRAVRLAYVGAAYVLLVVAFVSLARIENDVGLPNSRLNELSQLPSQFGAMLRRSAG